MLPPCGASKSKPVLAVSHGRESSSIFFQIEKLEEVNTSMQSRTSQNPVLFSKRRSNQCDSAKAYRLIREYWAAKPRSSKVFILEPSLCSRQGQSYNKAVITVPKRAGARGRWWKWHWGDFCGPWWPCSRGNEVRFLHALHSFGHHIWMIATGIKADFRLQQKRGCEHK